MMQAIAWEIVRNDPYAIPPVVMSIDEEFTNDYEVKVFPNPFSERISFRSGQPLRNARFRLFQMDGNLFLNHLILMVIPILFIPTFNYLALTCMN
ncbi:hypothetical protein [Ekhidna sp.]|uniref:hypothetical protein n=1 Tax=Ekhidna sp. TaxID=2608089 RepID=UPI003B5070F8